MSHFDKTAEEVYDHNQQAADKASTQRQENYDFYLKDPASLTDVQKSKVQKNCISFTRGSAFILETRSTHARSRFVIKRFKSVVFFFSSLQYR